LLIFQKYIFIFSKIYFEKNTKSLQEINENDEKGEQTILLFVLFTGKGGPKISEFPLLLRLLLQQLYRLFNPHPK